MKNLVNYHPLLRAKHFFTRTIWETHKHDATPPVLRFFYLCLRFWAIVWHGIVNNRMAGNAAALSYSMLIALGPMIAVVVMISGFMFHDMEEDVIHDVLNQLIGFISAPVTVQVDAASGEALSSSAQVSPEIVGAIEHLIDSARSGAVGLIGSLILIVISIQLIITIEKSLNLIWGVQRGRTFAQRVVFYWTFLSLGTILGLAVVALLSASTLTRYADALPYGASLIALVRWGAPVLSFALIVVLLASFYRFMPNTFVSWKAALGGGVFAVSLLFLNKELSFLYVSRIVRDQSLYGSIGLIPVFMFGLYLFWIFILAGGQISYAFQNVSTLTSLKAWEKTSRHTQECLSLAALVEIARRFKKCASAPSVEDLSEHLRVPQKMLNYCLTALVASHIISPVEPDDSDTLSPVRYQPARPLNAITLGHFRRSLETLGNDEGMRLLKQCDPIVTEYGQWLDRLYAEDSHFSKNLDDLV